MDQWRIAILGDSGVGKTALAAQFTMNEYCAVEDAYRKQLIVDNRMSFVEVIDKNGWESDVPLRDAWTRDPRCYILMYSISSRSTFDKIEVYRQTIRRVRGDPIFILVGNKCDQAYAREVTVEEGAALARQFGCDFMETSAKTAENVHRLFITLIRALRNRKESLEVTKQSVLSRRRSSA